MIEIFLQPYTKIFPDISPFSRFDNSQLTRMMENYWDYDNDNNKIKTGFDNCEPQLLMVYVDAIDASSAATFDSCVCKTNVLIEKAGNSKDTRNTDENDKEDKYYTKDYPIGILLEHVPTSMSPNA